MTWDYFIYFAIASVLCWIYGAYGQMMQTFSWLLTYLVLE